MNKNILTGLAISALALLSVSSSVVANNAAVVIDNAGCTLLDGDGNGFTADADHSVTASSGKSTFKCYASGVPNSTGKAVRFSSGNTEIYCYIPQAGGYATRWFETIDSEGNAVLTCQVK